MRVQNHAPTRTQLAEARKIADDSFCVSASEQFGLEGLPSHQDLLPASAVTLLRLANVEPHDDPWVGKSLSREKWVEPKVRKAIFWLLEFRSTKTSALYFCSNGVWVTMRRGNFVVFDDSQVHAVMSNGPWIGAAWQLLPPI